MKSSRGKIFNTIVIITFAAFILNFTWEMVQMPLFENMPFGDWQSFVTCFYATLGDVLIFHVFYFLGKILFRIWDWPRWLDIPKLIFLGVIGFLTAVYFETDALRTGRWQYSVLMPLIPGVKVGVIPVIQLMVLPILSYKISLKILNVKRRGSSPYKPTD